MNTANGKNRGYLKIESAARAFNFDFRDKVVLDIGSSTGGFTQYALDRGAKKVIAIEKGTNQMLPFLRTNPRVDLREKTDIFTVSSGAGVTERLFPERTCSPSTSYAGEPAEPPLSEANLSVASGIYVSGFANLERFLGKDVSVMIPTPDVILADVSFIPLTKILKYAKMNLSRSNTDFLVMLKPQFETTNKNDLNRGIIKNEKIRRRIIKDFEAWLKTNGFIIVNKKDNHLHGRHGNVERFYWLAQSK